MNQVFKRSLSVLLILSFLLLVFAAYGENAPWDCPQCGRTGNTGNFCGGCAYPRTDRPATTSTSTATPSPKPVSNRWPVWDSIEGSAVSLNVRKGMQRQSFFGPGNQYAGGGAFSTLRGATAIYRDNGYVLVNTGKRCVYFPAYYINGAPDKDIKLESYPAIITQDVIPMLGPGNENVFEHLKKVTVVSQSEPEDDDDLKESEDTTDPNNDKDSTDTKNEEGSTDTRNVDVTADSKNTEGSAESQNTDVPTKPDNKGESKEIDKTGNNAEVGKSDTFSVDNSANASNDTTNNQDSGTATLTESNNKDSTDKSKESKENRKSEKTDKPVSVRSSSGSRITTLVVLEERTAVKAFFEVDGWVFAEFDCIAGLARAWIPADKIAAE